MFYMFNDNHVVPSLFQGTKLQLLYWSTHQDLQQSNWNIYM